MHNEEWTKSRISLIIRQSCQGQEWEEMKNNGEEWPDFIARKMYEFSGECLTILAVDTLIPGLRDVNNELKNSIGKEIGIYYNANKPVKVVLE